MNLYRIEPLEDDAYTYIVANNISEALTKFKQNWAVLNQCSVNDIDDPCEIVLEAGGDYLVR